MNPEKLQRLLESEVDFDLGSVFTKAWEIYKTQAFLNVLFMLMTLAVQGFFVLNLQEYVLLYSLIIAPPLYSGLYLVANKISEGIPVTLVDYFSGFRYFLLCFTIWLIAQVAVALGLVLLIVPGVYLAVGYFFSVLMGMFGGFDFWTSMELSRKLVTRNWWKFFGLVLLLFGMNLVAALAMGVGLIITLPLTFFVGYVIFEELTRDVFGADSAPQKSIHEPES